MSYNFYTVRVSEKNTNTFSFPITANSLEDFTSMSLNDKLGFKKELEEIIEPLSDGYLETKTHFFEATQMVDDIYFFDSKYVSYYEALSEYEKEIFKSYIGNTHFDFNELNETYENYHTQYKNPDFLEKVKNHDAKLERLFQLLDLDDNLKARIFEKKIVDIEYAKQPAQLYFVSGRDKTNYDHLPENEQKKFIPFNAKILSAYSAVAPGLQLNNKRKESAQVVKDRHDRVNSAINSHNFQVFFDYLEDGQIEFKSFLSSLFYQDYDHGIVLDYLSKNQFPVFKDLTQEEAQDCDAQLKDYFFKYKKAEKNTENYSEHINKVQTYLEFLGVDINAFFSEPTKISGTYLLNEEQTVGEIDLLMLESGFFSLSIKNQILDSDPLYLVQKHLPQDAIDSVDSTKFYAKAVLQKIHQYYLLSPDKWNLFLEKSFENLAKNHIYGQLFFNKYSADSIDAQSLAQSAHKIKVIVEFLSDNSLSIPKSLYSPSQVISEVFTELRDIFLDAQKKQISQVQTEVKPLPDAQKTDEIEWRDLTEQEQLDYLNQRTQSYDNSKDYFLSLIETLKIQPILDKALLTQEISIGGTIEKKSQHKI